MALRKTLAKIYSQIRTIPTVSQAITPSAAILRHRRPFFEAAVPPDRWFPTGDRLIERIRALNHDRILLDAISPPRSPPPAAAEVGEKLSVEDVKKVIRASKMAVVRARLRAIPMNSVSYDEFLEICCKESGDQGIVIARALDDSGDVIIFGAVVFLRPELENIDGCRGDRISRILFISPKKINFLFS
ncbi:putative MCU family protein [Dioscorea sansibarensis]